MDKAAIETQLEKILESREFRQSSRMARFLSYAVHQVLSGEPAVLKESVMGVAVFDRPSDYDPRIDPIVRVEARRLRKKLEEYYASSGASDAVLIELPKGSYAPVFQHRSSTPAASSRALPAEPRILVLPFTNSDPGAGPDYLSDGLTQELIHVLTRLPGVQVVAWSTAARLRGLAAGDPLRQVEATAVLEGSVRRANERVRIGIQLADAVSGVNLWSGAYERPISGLFAMQQEVAHAVAGALRVQLALDSAPKPFRADAYDFYLRGRYEWFRRTPESLRQSVALFETALRIDETCAPAWAGLADAHTLLSDYGVLPPAEGMPKAAEAARRALTLDPTLAEAHVSLAIIVGLHDWKWAEAEQHYRRAIELNPSYATAHHWYGLDGLAVLARFDEAEHHLDVAQSLDPLEPILADGRAYLSILSRDYDDAAVRYQKLVATQPHFSKGLTGLGRAYFFLGRHRESIEMLERGLAITGDMPSTLAALCQVQAAAGNRAQAESCLARLEEMKARRHLPALALGIAHLGLGDHDRAMDELERSCAAHETSLAHINVHPLYDELRNHTRFQRLLKKMNFGT